MYGGQPFLASYQTGLLSPFVVLSVLLPPVDALLAHAVLRLLIGGAGMFLFLRRLGLAAPAVWFGALTLSPQSVHGGVAGASAVRGVVLAARGCCGRSIAPVARAVRATWRCWRRSPR